MQVADEIYRYVNHNTLMNKHLEITHTTDVFMEHSFFFYGVYFDIRERFRMGDYEIVYTDGTSEKLPIYWGYNIGNSNVGWGNEKEGYTVAIGDGNYCIPYVFETIGATLPVREGEKTWHRLVVPTDKDVKSVIFKALDGYKVEVKEWSVK